jgi:hypothetical protein
MSVEKPWNDLAHFESLLYSRVLIGCASGAAIGMSLAAWFHRPFFEFGSAFAVGVTCGCWIALLATMAQDVLFHGKK